MLVTINTDASFYQKEKIGGFAIWIASNKGRVKYANGFKGEIKTSHDAEFKCIINALYLLKKQSWEITEIYINTDCLSVIQIIEGTRLFNKLPQYSKDNFMDYLKIINELGVKHISLRKVKAHQHTKTARHWVNQWCDKEAKKSARKILKNNFGVILK